MGAAPLVMTRRANSLLCTAALAAALAGCGGSGGTGGSGGAQAEGPGPTVTMKNIQFVPRDQQVKVGETVKWVNEDSVAHTVTKASGPGPQFDSGSVPGGGRFAQKFDAPGKIDYVCQIHPNHKGSLTVK